MRIPPRLLLLPAALALLFCCSARPRGDAGLGACQKTGCSGEVCAPDPVQSICVFDPSFECYRTARCERQADGQCGFTRTPELERCLGRDGGRAAPSVQ